MSNFLPGPSDPTVEESNSSVEQISLVSLAKQIRVFDEEDEARCREVILRIPGDLESGGNSGMRFSAPKLVGQGTYGLVFACRDSLRDGTRVAVKILRPSKQNDRIPRERFQEEIRVVSELHHPNIVAIFSTGETDQIPWMVVDCADAGSLAMMLQRDRFAFSPSQAAWLVLRIALAVDAAHSTLILHRDIKPGNILLRKESPEISEGLGFWPLLTDFGLSKNLGSNSNPGLTLEGQVLGTLSYMSPEQVQGQPLKIQSDIFPLGVILHELAYAQHPFQGADDFQTRNNIVSATPRRSQDHHRRVPSSLDAIITKCMRKRPEDRYQHASDLAQDLDHFLTGKPISVSPPTPWQSIAAWAAAHPIASTFVATILFCAVASILLLSNEWRLQRELARESRILADDRAQISELFLESMRATNSGINDSILAGQRVLPTTLLQTLERQIPLLEDALALAPNDYMLIRQLEIMYHYKSLCHDFSSTQRTQPDWQAELEKATAARRQSLRYIEMLIERFPEDENLQVSLISGEFLMSAIVQQGEESNEKLYSQWIDKAIADADVFLAKHPDHFMMLETANRIRLDRCNAMSSEVPQEYLRELERVIEVNRSLLQRDPARSTLLTYSAFAMSRRSRKLLELGRKEEGLAAFQELESFAAEHKDMIQKEWSITDQVLTGYVLVCEELVKNKHVDELLRVSERWQMWLESSKLSNYAIIQSNRLENAESLSLFPSYYRWLAVSQVSPQSRELRVAEEKLRETISRCIAQSESDLAIFAISIEDPERKKTFAELVDAVKGGRSQSLPEKDE